METSSNFYSIFFSKCFSNRKYTIFLEKASGRRKRRRESWKTTGFSPLLSVQMDCSDLLGGWRRGFETSSGFSWKELSD